MLHPSQHARLRLEDEESNLFVGSIALNGGVCDHNVSGLKGCFACFSGRPMTVFNVASRPPRPTTYVQPKRYELEGLEVMGSMS